jgi:hypothetical protein
MRQLKAIHDLFRFEAICSGMRQKYSGTRRVPVLGRTELRAEPCVEPPQGFMQSVLPTAIEESLVQIGRRRTPWASLQQELTESLLVLRSTLKQNEPDGGLCYKVLHNLNQ